ncbi:MAG: PadR family transcriptional regulator [Ferruginibacter sp.]
MNQNSRLFKGSLTSIILKLLSEKDKMYGYEITKKVKELTNGSLSLTEGALYPCLHKLEADGFLSVSVEHFENRPRKYYSLTKNGKKEMKIRIEEFQNFISQMRSVLNFKLSID